MRSDGQYDSIARALDIVGDRWVLLIIFELLDRPGRYTDLAEGLPGIATNLLTERLRSLKTNGLGTKADDRRYRLTGGGEALRDVVHAIGRWVSPSMDRLRPGESFPRRWIVHPLAGLFAGVDPSRPHMIVALHCGEEPVTIRSVDGRVMVDHSAADAPTIVRGASVCSLVGSTLQRPQPAA